MSINIRDPEAVKAILPAGAALYLRSRGWQQVKAEPWRASTWALTKDGEEFEALLLTNVELRDYALRMGELLKVLAVVEKRSPEQVAADLLAISSDVLREREPLEEFELRGPVVKLERAEGGAAGRVTMMGLVEGRQARVTVQLPEAQYTIAVDAHRQGQTIRTTGTLQREGRGLVLREPGAVAVEEEVAAE
jgi:hypothetical protein